MKINKFNIAGKIAKKVYCQHNNHIPGPPISSAFFNTQLDWVLRRAGITTVVVCGIVTNGGVASTVRDAHMRDYRTLVLADGCAAFRTEAHDTALADMTTVAQVLVCADFSAALAAAPT